MLLSRSDCTKKAEKSNRSREMKQSFIKRETINTELNAIKAAMLRNEETRSREVSSYNGCYWLIYHLVLIYQSRSQPDFCL